MVDSVQAAKAVSRKRITAALNALSTPEIQQQSSAITQKALQIEQYRNAKSISIFLSMPGREISTREIVLQALRDGKQVYVPYIYASKTPKTKAMDMLRLRDEDDLNALQPDAWGIPSISADSVASRQNALGGFGCSEDTEDPSYGSSTLDLIFMPAMAFDASLHRLGHGKGFYDRYLTIHKDLSLKRQQARTVPHLIGLALREQILPKGELVPVDEHDWKVDQVISADS